MDARRTAILGIGIAAFGLVCVAGGIALLAWRILKPDEAVIIPPGMVFEIHAHARLFRIACATAAAA